MLGEQVCEERGRITLQRRIGSEGPNIETSYLNNIYIKCRLFS
jgi:hypothetical protein